MADFPTAIHIIAKLELGGAQRIAIETAKRLEGYRNILIAGTEGPLVEEASGLPRVETVLLPCLKREVHPILDFCSFFKIGRVISREVAGGRQVIVHSHGSKAGFLARLAARRAGVSAVIHTVHGFAFHEYQARFMRVLYVAAERLCARFCDALVAVSRATMRKGLKERIGTPEQYRVINPAIEDEHFKRVEHDPVVKREELGIGRSSLVVGTVSCFKPQKAPLDFVETAERVRASFAGVEFVMVGDGVLMGEVKEAVSRRGLKPVFHLPGWRRDIPEIMDLFDVFVLTSLWEGLPMVHAEAMCRGKPIVATAVDGTPEAVLEGVNGFLAQAGDVEGLADGIITLLRDEKLRQKMGKAGRTMVFPRFTMDRLVRDVTSLYDGLLGTTLRSRLSPHR